MISNRIVGADFDFFRYFVFFHEFRKFSSEIIDAIAYTAGVHIKNILVFPEKIYEIHEKTRKIEKIEIGSDNSIRNHKNMPDPEK